MTMNTSIRRLAFSSMLGCAIVGLGGCDDLLTESPPNILTVDNLYATAEGFEAGLAGLYELARRQFLGFNGGGANELRSLFATVGVDNAIGGTNDNISRMVTDLGTRLHSGHGDVHNQWAWLYEIINSANTLIGRADNPEVVWSDAERDAAIAEARFLRAWAYRHLTYLFGDVPLALEESLGESIKTDWERTPVADVRSQIEADLLFAEEHLPEQPRDGRVSKGVAQHFLAELYLAMDRPADAEQKAQAVLASGYYQLITERYGVGADQPGVAFMDPFLEGNTLHSQGNTEALWTFQYELDVQGGGEHILRRTWTPNFFNIPGIDFSFENTGRGQQRAFPSLWAIELYEPGDDRGSGFALRRYYIYDNEGNLPEGVALGDTLWLEPMEIATEAERQEPRIISTRKWDQFDPGRPTEAKSYNDVAYVRLAETYLLLAEAQLAQGGAAGAAETINVLRRRAGASEIDAADVTLDFILEERSRELLAEEERRYTLIRTGTFAQRVRAYNPAVAPNFEDHHVLLPIPQRVIDANLEREMAQNPGY